LSAASWKLAGELRVRRGLRGGGFAQLPGDRRLARRIEVRQIGRDILQRRARPGVVARRQPFTDRRGRAESAELLRELGDRRAALGRVRVLQRAQLRLRLRDARHRARRIGGAVGEIALELRQLLLDRLLRRRIEVAPRRNPILYLSDLLRRLADQPGIGLLAAQRLLLRVRQGQQGEQRERAESEREDLLAAQSRPGGGGPSSPRYQRRRLPQLGLREGAVRRAARQFERGDDPLAQPEVGIGARGDGGARQRAERPDERPEHDPERERPEAPFERLGREEEGAHPREDTEPHAERQPHRQPVGGTDAGGAQAQSPGGIAQQGGNRGGEDRRCRLDAHLLFLLSFPAVSRCAVAFALVASWAVVADLCLRRPIGSNGQDGVKVSRLVIMGNYSKSRAPFAEPCPLSGSIHAMLRRYGTSAASAAYNGVAILTSAAR